MNAEIKKEEAAEIIKEIKKSRLQILKEKQTKLNKEVKDRTIGYLLAAFGLVAGLAWNDAVKSFIEVFFPFQKDSIFVKFIYAVIVTLIVVLVTVYLTKITSKTEEKK